MYYHKLSTSTDIANFIIDEESQREFGTHAATPYWLMLQDDAKKDITRHEHCTAALMELAKRWPTLTPEEQSRCASFTESYPIPTPPIGQAFQKTILDTQVDFNKSAADDKSIAARARLISCLGRYQTPLTQEQLDAEPLCRQKANSLWLYACLSPQAALDCITQQLNTIPLKEHSLAICRLGISCGTQIKRHPDFKQHLITHVNTLSEPRRSIVAKSLALA